MAEPAPIVVNNTSQTSDKKKVLILVIVILVIAIAISVYFYFKGKDAGSTETNLNISSPLNPDGSAPAASEQEIKLLADELHTDMAGVNAYHNLAPWDKLLTYSDSDFVRVNNSFNMQYQTQSGESFKTWLDGESTSWWGSTGNIPFSNRKATVLAKMKKLNIE